MNSGGFNPLRTAEDWGCSLTWGSWLLWLPKHFSAPGVEDGVGDALPWGSCPVWSGVGRISGCRWKAAGVQLVRGWMEKSM